MLKYELTIQYHWAQYGDSGHGKPVPITVYAENHDDAPPSFDLPELTRVAVVSEKDVEFQTHGGMYEHGAWVSIQDDGKTLKLFPMYEGGERVEVRDA